MMCDTTESEEDILPPELEVIKDIPCYRVILKAILRYQIQQLLTQLSEYTEEESVILSASLSDGTFSHLGTTSGKVFLEEHEGLKSSFLNFCLKRNSGRRRSDSQNSSPSISQVLSQENKVFSESSLSPTGQVLGTEHACSAKTVSGTLSTSSPLTQPHAVSSTLSTSSSQTWSQSILRALPTSGSLTQPQSLARTLSTSSPLSQPQSIWRALPTSCLQTQPHAISSIQSVSATMSRTQSSLPSSMPVISSNQTVLTSPEKPEPRVLLRVLPGTSKSGVRIQPYLIPKFGTQSGNSKDPATYRQKPRVHSTSQISSTARFSSEDNETNFRIVSVRGAVQDIHETSADSSASVEPQVKMEIPENENANTGTVLLNSINSSVSDTSVLDSANLQLPEGFIRGDNQQLSGSEIPDVRMDLVDVRIKEEETEVDRRDEMSQSNSKKDEEVKTEPSTSKVVDMKPSASQTIVMTPSAPQIVAVKPSASQAVTMKLSTSQTITMKPSASQVVVSPSVSQTITMKPSASQTIAVKPLASQTISMKPSPSQTITMKSSAPQVVVSPSASQTITMKPSASQTVAMKPPASHTIIVKPLASQTISMKPSPSQTITMKSSGPQVVASPSASKTIPLKPSASQTIAVKPLASQTISMKPSPSQTITMKSSAPQAIYMKPSAPQAVTMESSASPTVTMKPSASQVVVVKTSTSQALERSTSQAVTMKPSELQAVAMKPSASQAVVVKPSASQAVAVKPSTSQAVTMKPSALQAVTMKPSSSQAVAVKPSTSQAVTMKPSALQAVAMKASASKPVTMKSLSSQAVAMKPSASQVVVVEPSASQAVTILKQSALQALTMKPFASQSADIVKESASQAVAMEPSASLAVTMEPSASLAVTMEPSASQAVAMEPSASQAVAMEPSTSLAVTMEPSASLAVIMEPSTSQAVAMEPSTSQAVAMEPSTLQIYINQQGLQNKQSPASSISYLPPPPPLVRFAATTSTQSTSNLEYLQSKAKMEKHSVRESKTTETQTETESENKPGSKNLKGGVDTESECELDEDKESTSADAEAEEESEYEFVDDDMDVDYNPDVEDSENSSVDTDEDVPVPEICSEDELSEVCPVLPQKARLRISPPEYDSEDSEESLDEEEILRDSSNPEIYIRRVLFSDFTKTGKIKKHNRVYNYYHYCGVCRKKVTDFRQHLSRHAKRGHAHNSEPAILAIRREKDDQVKKKLLKVLRAKFHHQFNMKTIEKGKGEILLEKRPLASFKVKDYGPCPQCLVWVVKKGLKGHQKKCFCQKARVSRSLNDLITQSDCLSKRIKPIATRTLVKEVFRKMLNDEATNAVKGDTLIIQLGNQWLARRAGNAKKPYYIAQIIRLIGRFLLNLRKIRPIPEVPEPSVWDYLKPDLFNSIVQAAILTASPVQDDENDFHSPTNAIRLGPHLKRLLNGKIGLAITENDPKSQEDAEKLLKLMNRHWGSKVCQAARISLEEKKYYSEKILPCPEDIEQLNCHLRDSISQLDHTKADKANFQRVAELIEAKLMMYNRRRSDDIQAVRLCDYTKRRHVEAGEDLVANCTDLEKKLLENQEVLTVRGKTGRTVPVILPCETAPGLQYLADPDVRASAGVSDSNQFIFASHGESIVLANDAIRKLSEAALLKDPVAVASPNLRRYVGTVTQVLNLTEDEMQWAVSHVGCIMEKHIIKLQYRAPGDTLGWRQIAKMLLIQDQGRLGEFQNKCLDDINLKDIVFTKRTKQGPKEDTDVNLFDPSIGSVGLTCPEIVQETLNKAEELFSDILGKDELTEVEPKPSNQTQTASRSYRNWSQDEENEIKEIFKPFFEAKIRPKPPDCVKAIKKSKANGGFICKRKKDVLKKKLFRMIDNLKFQSDT